MNDNIKRLKSVSEERYELKEEMKSRLQHHKIEKKVEKIRQLKFKDDPDYKKMSKDNLEKYLSEEIKEDVDEEELKNIEKTMKKFGLIPESYPLIESLLKLYKEQVGAFYSVKEQSLYTFEGLPYTLFVQDAFLAHELTHALQDQHFNLKRIIDPEDKDNNDDLNLTYHAFIEGDATLLTQFYFMKSLRIGALWDLLTYMFTNNESYNQSPVAIQAQLLFPYVQGAEFILAIFMEEGWKGVNKIYDKLPLSTEQILHPEKYLQYEAPITKWLFPELESEFIEHKLIYDNVLGEFMIRVFCNHFLAETSNISIAAGWGNDRYQIWENEESGALDMVWATIWDTHQDALDFFQAMKRIVAIKFPQAHLKSYSDSRYVWTESKSGYILLRLKYDKIIYLEVNAENRYERIEELFF